MPNVFSYLVSSISSVAPAVSQIILRPKQSPALSYQAGQYIEVMHGEGALSPLSIACAALGARPYPFESMRLLSARIVLL